MLLYVKYTLIRYSGTRKKSTHILIYIRYDLYNHKYVRKTANLYFFCFKLNGSEQLLYFVPYVSYYKNTIRVLFMAFNLSANNLRGIYQAFSVLNEGLKRDYQRKTVQPRLTEGVGYLKYRHNAAVIRRQRTIRLAGLPSYCSTKAPPDQTPAAKCGFDQYLDNSSDPVYGDGDSEDLYMAYDCTVNGEAGDIKSKCDRCFAARSSGTNSS